MSSVVKNQAGTEREWSSHPLIFAQKTVEKIRSPNPGRKIQSVSRAELSFDGNQILFCLSK
jgi:hypothetical protein